MIHTSFKKWNDDNLDTLQKMGIHFDYINQSSNTSNNSVAIDYKTEKCLGRVCVWESGFIDIEVLDIKSAQLLLWKHYDVDKPPDYWRLLGDFFDTLKSGHGVPLL